jgi:hypothetical protein
MMAAQIKNMDQARALKIAREVMTEFAYTRGVVWKKRIRFEWQTKLRRPFLLELLGNGDLRMIDTKTGQIITQGPAWAASDSTGQTR